METEKIIEEILKKTQAKKKLEFSKLVIIFVGIFCMATWAVAVISWFMWQQFPHEIVQYTGWFAGTAIAYMCKTAYENKPKIEKGGQNDTRTINY